MLAKGCQRTVVVMLALGALVFGFYMANGGRMQVTKPVAMVTGSQLPEPQPMPDFVLQGAKQAMTKAQLKGAWHLLFFGFTRCPGICPTTLSTVHLSMQQLATWGEQTPTLWFVSIDPAHDTAQVTDRYAKSFDSDYVGLSGKPEAIASLAKQLNVVYGSVETTDHAGHHHMTMNHSTHLILVNPQAEMVAVITHPQDAKGMARDLKQLMKN